MSERGMDIAWMGLTKEANNCDDVAAPGDDCRVKGWQWQDGSPYDYYLSDWNGDHEPKRTELCAALTHGDWYNGLVSQSCRSRDFYICEKGIFL